MKGLSLTLFLLCLRNMISVTVIACGERWNIPSEDGELRMALEDYLGAGAILSYLPYEKSPEARACVKVHSYRPAINSKPCSGSAAVAANCGRWELEEMSPMRLS
jgi:phosphosulfolactate phosphohydrolase-like enzyme